MDCDHHQKVLQRKGYKSLWANWVLVPKIGNVWSKWSTQMIITGYKVIRIIRRFWNYRITLILYWKMGVEVFRLMDKKPFFPAPLLGYFEVAQALWREWWVAANIPSQPEWKKPSQQVNWIGVINTVNKFTKQWLCCLFIQRIEIVQNRPTLSSTPDYVHILAMLAQDTTVMYNRPAVLKQLPSLAMASLTTAMPTKIN